MTTKMTCIFRKLTRNYKAFKHLFSSYNYALKLSQDRVLNLDLVFMRYLIDARNNGAGNVVKSIQLNAFQEVSLQV